MRLAFRDGVCGRAELDGVGRDVMLDLVPEVRVGQYVIVHAGYAIQILEEAEAEETRLLLDSALGERRLR